MCIPYSVNPMRLTTTGSPLSDNLSRPAPGPVASAMLAEGSFTLETEAAFCITAVASLGRRGLQEAI